MRMEDGPALHRLAVRAMQRAGEQALASAGLAVEAVDWWVPHQASSRIIRETGTRLGIDEERAVDRVAHHANTSAASIPLALDSLRESGQLRRGQKVLLTAAGAGLVSAGLVLHW